MARKYLRFALLRAINGQSYDWKELRKCKLCTTPTRTSWKSLREESTLETLQKVLSTYVPDSSTLQGES